MKKIVQPLGSRAIRLLKNIRVKVAALQGFNFAVLVDEINPSKARRIFGIRLKERNLLCQFVGRPQVVGMVNRDIFPARRVHRLANGNDGAAIFLVQEKFYARVFEGLDNVAAQVGRAVVDYQQLKIRERLAKHAVNRRRHICRVIVAGQHDADYRNSFFKQNHHLVESYPTNRRYSPPSSSPRRSPPTSRA